MTKKFKRPQGWLMIAFNFDCYFNKSVQTVCGEIIICLSVSFQLMIQFIFLNLKMTRFWIQRVFLRVVFIHKEKLERFSAAKGSLPRDFLEGVSKNFRNFVELFFRSTKLIFLALTNHLKVPIWPNFLHRRQNLKKKGQKKHL